MTRRTGGHRFISRKAASPARRCWRGCRKRQSCCHQLAVTERGFLLAYAGPANAIRTPLHRRDPFPVPSREKRSSHTNGGCILAVSVKESSSSTKSSSLCLSRLWVPLHRSGCLSFTHGTKSKQCRFPGRLPSNYRDQRKLPAKVHTVLRDRAGQCWT